METSPGTGFRVSGPSQLGTRNLGLGGLTARTSRVRSCTTGLLPSTERWRHAAGGPSASRVAWPSRQCGCESGGPARAIVSARGRQPRPRGRGCAHRTVAACERGNARGCPVGPPARALRSGRRPSPLLMSGAVSSVTAICGRQLSPSSCSESAALSPTHGRPCPLHLHYRHSFRKYVVETVCGCPGNRTRPPSSAARTGLRGTGPLAPTPTSPTPSFGGAFRLCNVVDGDRRRFRFARRRQPRGGLRLAAFVLRVCCPETHEKPRITLPTRNTLSPLLPKYVDVLLLCRCDLRYLVPNTRF